MTSSKFFTFLDPPPPLCHLFSSVCRTFVTPLVRDIIYGWSPTQFLPKLRREAIKSRNRSGDLLHQIPRIARWTGRQSTRLNAKDAELFPINPIQGWAKVLFPGLVNFPPAVACHFCLNLPAAFTKSENCHLAPPVYWARNYYLLWVA